MGQRCTRRVPPFPPMVVSILPPSSLVFSLCLAAFRKRYLDAGKLKLTNVKCGVQIPYFPSACYHGDACQKIVS